MINITYDGVTKGYDVPPVLKDVAKDFGVKDALAVSVNQRLRELAYILTKDAEVKFLTYNNADAIKIYESTLRYVIAKAVHNLYPKAKLKFNYTVSRSILGVFESFDGILDDKVINSIRKEVQRLIDLDLSIERRRISVGEATILYQKFNMQDKVDILKYREEEYVNLYECDGYMNYMFGYMLPSTGYLRDFKMFLYHPGFIIQYPRAEFDGKIPEFFD